MTALGLRSLIRSAATSTLIFTTNTIFANAFVGARANFNTNANANTNTNTNANMVRRSSPSKLFSTIPSPSPSPSMPAPIQVAPGTSPLEDQEKVNPIDSSCTVLIVGANRGIGLEFVKQCLARGATVIASYRSDRIPFEIENLLVQQYAYQHEQAQAQAHAQAQQNQTQQPQPQHPQVQQLYTIQMDLRSESSIEKAATICEHILVSSGLGHLTHIIHNAGIYLPGSSFDGTARGPRNAAPKVTKETLMKTYEINTIAPLLMAQNFIPLMGKRSEELYPVLSILSSKVGSVDDNGSGGAYAYRSSKSALNNIAKSLSVDLGGEARVVLLHPGYVRTDMTNGNGFIDVDESVGGMLNAVEATNVNTGFRFVDYKACLIPW